MEIYRFILIIFFLKYNFLQVRSFIPNLYRYLICFMK